MLRRWPAGRDAVVGLRFFACRAVPSGAETVKDEADGNGLEGTVYGEGSVGSSVEEEK